MESRQGPAASGSQFSPDIWQDDGTRMSVSCVTGRRYGLHSYQFGWLRYSELIGAEQFLVAEACNHPNCPIKRNVKRNISPSGRYRASFLGIQPNCLSAHTRCERGLLQVQCPVRFPARIGGTLPLWSISLLWRRQSFPETNKPDGYPLCEWQRMVLSETRGSMAFLDCPRGHRV
jgi:hypothetical protein